MWGLNGSLLKRAALGGAIGGAMTGDWGGALGGAAVAGAGWGAMSTYGPKYLARGGKAAARGLSTLGGRVGRGAWDLTVAGAARGWGGMGLNRAARGVGYAANMIGRSSTVANKWAGRAIGAMGIGAGAYIGSSVLSSNRGYR